MAKDINLNAPDWCDLVFEEKNKSYGAYVMRRTSDNRHLHALIVTVGLLLFIMFLPTIISTVQKLTASRIKHEDRTVLTDIKSLEERVKEENIKRATEAPPPPPMKSTIKFTAPEITDEEIPEGDELQSMEDLTSNKTQISVATVIGDNEEAGMDIADLEGQQILAGMDEPTYGAEVMPQFPGGEEALFEFINANLKYPPQAAEMGVTGQVTIRFVVGTDGSVSDITTFRSLDPYCDREAMRVVRLMPNWIPGRQNGKAVRVYFLLPIRYKLTH